MKRLQEAIKKAQSLTEGARYNPKTFKFNMAYEGEEISYKEFLDNPGEYIVGKTKGAEWNDFLDTLESWNERHKGLALMWHHEREAIPLWNY